MYDMTKCAFLQYFHFNDSSKICLKCFFTFKIFNAGMLHVFLHCCDVFFYFFHHFVCVRLCVFVCARQRFVATSHLRTACDIFATMQTQRLLTVARTLTHAYAGVHGVARAICWMTGCLESGWGEGEVERGWSGEGRQRCGGEDKLDAQKQTVFVPEGRWVSACATTGRAAL